MMRGGQGKNAFPTEHKPKKSEGLGGGWGQKPSGDRLK